MHRVKSLPNMGIELESINKVSCVTQQDLVLGYSSFVQVFHQVSNLLDRLRIIADRWPLLLTTFFLGGI